MATEQYNQTGQEDGDFYGNPSTSQPYVVRETNGSAIYYYDCMPEDFAGQLRWPWITGAVGAFFLLFPVLLNWLTIEILGGKTSFDGFGTLKGTALNDLQPTNFNNSAFITALNRGDVSVLGFYSFTGWILIGLAVVALAFSITGFFIKQKWPSYVVAAAGGGALAWTVFQFVSISNTIGGLSKSLKQVIDAKGTVADETAIVISGGADFAPWIAMVFAALVLFSGVYYAVRG